MAAFGFVALNQFSRVSFFASHALLVVGALFLPFTERDSTAAFHPTGMKIRGG
jgi:hypothetical protein